MGISVTSKADLRKKVLELRKNLTKEETDGWDQAICQKIKNLGLEKQYGTIYCYISVRGETGTEVLIRWYLEQGLKVAVPRVKGREMAFYYIDCFEDLEPGCFGIPEPKKSCMTAEETDAPVIVPGVAFSERFERTGYGAGYYDRFFEKEPQHRKIAICYDFQIAEAIAVDQYDVLMDQIITPGRELSRL